jgi:integrase
VKDFTSSNIIPHLKGSDDQDWRTSKDGYKFDLQSKRWQLNNKRSLHLTEVHELLRPSLLNSCIQTLATEATHFSAVTMVTRLSGLVNFFRYISAQGCDSEITLAMLINYRDHRLKIDGHDKYMSDNVRPFLKKWNSLGHPGVSIETVRHICRWRLKSPEAGVAVNREDVNQGPLMPDEHAALEAQWLAAFERRDFSLDQYAFLRLLSVTGRRPVQIIQLKLKDLDNSRKEDSQGNSSPTPLHLLHIPRAKGNGHAFRSRFRAVPLSSGLWELLIAQRHNVAEHLDKFLSTCQIELQPADLAEIEGEMPLFPYRKAMEKTSSVLRAAVQAGYHGKAINDLRDTIKGEEWHRIHNYPIKLLDKAEALIDASNREGGRLHLFARRFRYTLEFNLEQQGCTPAVIAWNLDHSSTKHLVSYSKNGPDKARRLSKAMALKLQPYIKMFQGKIVDDEKNVPGADPAVSRIQIDEHSGGATCAQNRACGLNSIPRCCYNGCVHFRPWIDGPHEQYLISLLAERQRDLETLRPIEDRAIIEAGDSLILGVVQVIRLCEERKAQLAQNKKSRSPRKATQ